MYIRKDPLVNGNCYHIFSRSIAKYTVFNNAEDFSRLIELFKLYRFSDFNYKYSRFTELGVSTRKVILENLKSENNLLVEIIAYCVMPTHIHLLLKQIANDGISKFVSKVLNSYTRNFNLKHHRIGPLWESKFKNVNVRKDEQLLHLTRYIHLNPTSAGLVKKPEDWLFSSYREYMGENKDNFCNFVELLDLTPQQYQVFVNERKSYQQELAKIKKFTIDNYSG